MTAVAACAPHRMFVVEALTGDTPSRTAYVLCAESSHLAALQQSLGGAQGDGLAPPPALPSGRHSGVAFCQVKFFAIQCELQHLSAALSVCAAPHAAVRDPDVSVEAM